MNKFVQKFLLLSFVAFTMMACKGEDKPDTTKLERTKEEAIALQFVNKQPMHTIGQQVELEITIDTTYGFTELELYSFIKGKTHVLDPHKATQQLRLDSKVANVGKLPIIVSGKTKEGEEVRVKEEVIFFSDFAPDYKSAIIVKEYAHAPSSYTQGLEFYQGRLFEGTGMNGQSILAEVDLPTGKILRQKDLDKKYFGEGITILNDTIYQITWQSGVCIMYNMDFEEIGQMNYSGE